MKIKIKAKEREVVDEISAGGGFGGGYAAPLAPKEDELNEMFSTQGIHGNNARNMVSGEEEFAGQRERGLNFQKLQNYKEQMGEKSRSFRIKIKRKPQK